LFENDKLFSGGSPKVSEHNGKPGIFRQIKDGFRINPTDKVDLQDFLERVGKSVVKNRSIHTKYKQDPSQHAMGYCNRESIVVFPSSVPTMTVSALWCSGDFEGKSWKALIPRHNTARM
jgi:hypothetical protein